MKISKPKGLAFSNACTSIKDDIKGGYTETFNKVKNSFVSLEQLYMTTHKVANMLAEDTRKRGELKDADNRVLILVANALAPAYLELSTLRGILPSLPVSYTTVNKLYETYYTYFMMFVYHLSELFGDTYILSDRIYLNRFDRFFATGVATTFESAELFKAYKNVAEQARTVVASLKDTAVTELFASTQHLRKDFWGEEMFDYAALLSEYLSSDWDLATILSQRIIKKDIVLGNTTSADVPKSDKDKEVAALRVMNSLRNAFCKQQSSIGLANFNNVGVTYTESADDTSKYLRMGYADDLLEMLKNLKGSMNVSQTFRTYATYQVNTQAQDAEIRKTLNTFNRRLCVEDNLDGYQRKYELFETPVTSAIRLADCIGKLSYAAVRDSVVPDTREQLEKRTLVEDVKEAPDKRDTVHKRAQDFSFTALGIPIGATLTYTSDPRITCTIINDKHVEYKGKDYTLAALVRTLKGDSKKYFGAQYFKYRGELLRNMPKIMQNSSDAQASNVATGSESDKAYSVTDLDTTKLPKFDYSRFTFSMLGVPVGAKLQYTHQQGVTATVVDDTHVEYEGKIYTLSGLVCHLKKDTHVSTYYGLAYFSYNGVLLKRIRAIVEGKIKPDGTFDHTKRPMMTVPVEPTKSESGYLSSEAVEADLANGSRTARFRGKMGRLSFNKLGIPIGAKIHYVGYPEVEATVKNYYCVEYEGNLYTPSELVCFLKNGHTDKKRVIAYNGRYFFTYNGELLADIQKRVLLGITNSTVPTNSDSTNDTDTTSKKSGGKRFSFKALGISYGERIRYAVDSSIAATVIDANHVEYAGGRYTLSELVYTLKHNGKRADYKKTDHYKGDCYFTYKGELLANMRNRLGLGSAVDTTELEDAKLESTKTVNEPTVKAEKKTKSCRPHFSFAKMGIPVGAKLTYAEDPNITVTVASTGGNVEYEGEIFTLPHLIYYLKKGVKYCKPCAPWYEGAYFFKYEGELLNDRRNRLGV